MSVPNEKFFCLILFVFLLTAFFQNTDAQISMKGSEYKTYSTLYTVTQATDSIFILDNFSNNRPMPGDSLVATSSMSGSFDFEWRKLDTEGKPLSTILLQSSGTKSSLAIPSQGGFQVHITGTSLDTVFRAWVFFASKLSIDIDKTTDGKVKEYNCSSLLLKSTVTVDTFTYADPTSGESITFPSDSLISSILWTSANGNVVASGKPTVRIYSPPTVDTRYTLTVVSVFGNSVSDYVDYVSVIPKADFSYQAKDWSGQFKSFNSASDSLSAIATLRFTNKSINSQQYIWILSDTLMGEYTPLPVEIDTTLKSYQPEYSYYIPRTYSPVLIAINNKLGCRDTAVYNAKDANTYVYRVLVGLSEMQGGISADSLPNVFSPNGDGANDYFRPYMPSIKNFKLVVYNRLGRKIYEYKHNPAQRIDEWLGWDGKTSSGSMVEPGIYYYVIEAVGWDGVAYRTKKYSSALAIYR